MFHITETEKTELRFLGKHNMHILETYALLSGAQIDKCFIETENYDIQYPQYVLLHADCSKASARQYKNWDKVINLLKQDQNFNLPIVQIGGITDHNYDVDLSLLGQTNTHQLAYIISKCSLLLCYDSLPMHLASHFQKKIVALFSYYSSNSGPYFSNNEDIILLEPDFSKIKPSHMFDDPYDLINTISPEKIYQAIINLLQI